MESQLRVFNKALREQMTASSSTEKKRKNKKRLDAAVAKAKKAKSG